MFTTAVANPDIATELFETDIKAALDKFAPLRRFTKRVGSAANRWLSVDAISAKRKSRRCERKFRLHQTEQNSTDYKAAREQAVKLINQSTSQFIKNEVSSSADNPRTLWRTVNRILHPGDACRRYGGRPDQEVANGFSAYCADKLSRIRETIRITMSNFKLPSRDVISPTQSDIVLDNLGAVKADDVSNVIKKMSNKSSPLDIMPTSLLKSCLPEISRMIANIANASFDAGIFSSSMKIGQVTPLIKSRV